MRSENKLKETGYIPTDDICYAVFGMLALNKPLLVEGAPGVGKTSLAKALAEVMGLPMLRLQMYDGLTKDEVLYDYDYQRQLLTLEAVKPKLNEEIKDLGINDAIKHSGRGCGFLWGKEFLIPRRSFRPLMEAAESSFRAAGISDCFCREVRWEHVELSEVNFFKTSLRKMIQAVKLSKRLGIIIKEEGA